MARRRLVAVAWVGLAWAAGAVLTQAGARREVRILMGTTVEVAVDGVSSRDRVLDAAFDAIRDVEQACSRWTPDGELVRLNAAGRGTTSPTLHSVLARALDVARASDGAFDPTVGTAPRLAECAEGGATRGYECVQTGSRGLVTLRGGARLDLDGVSKGQAADAAVEALRLAGARSGAVDLGGSSVRVFGAPVDVAVADPADPEGPAWAMLTLSDEALSSSGQARRPGHLRDLRRGVAADAALGVVVIAASAAEADALSTALFVLGRDGLDLVGRRDAEGLVLWREAGRRVIAATPGLADRHGLRLAPGVEMR